MKPTFVFLFYILCSCLSVFGQSKETLNLEITNLKAQVQTLEQQNQELVVKTATLQKDIEFLQRQIDELRVQALRQPSQMPAAGNPPTPAAVKTTGQFGRCRATTQKGTQCSRNGKSNGYCYQHGGV